jgi:hypothetical protein
VPAEFALDIRNPALRAFQAHGLEQAVAGAFLSVRCSGSVAEPLTWHIFVPPSVQPEPAIQIYQLDGRMSKKPAENCP